MTIGIAGTGAIAAAVAGGMAAGGRRITAPERGAARPQALAGGRDRRERRS